MCLLICSSTQWAVLQWEPSNCYYTLDMSTNTLLSQFLSCFHIYELIAALIQCKPALFLSSFPFALWMEGMSCRKTGFLRHLCVLALVWSHWWTQCGCQRKFGGFQEVLAHSLKEALVTAWNGQVRGAMDQIMPCTWMSHSVMVTEQLQEMKWYKSHLEHCWKSSIEYK